MKIDKNKETFMDVLIGTEFLECIEDSRFTTKGKKYRVIEKIGSGKSQAIRIWSDRGRKVLMGRGFFK